MSEVMEAPDNIEEAMNELEAILTAILLHASVRILTRREVRDLAAALKIKSPV